MDAETFLEVKSTGISFKGNDISMEIVRGKWNHIAIIWKSDGNYELMINGIKKTSTTNLPNFQDK